MAFVNLHKLSDFSVFVNFRSSLMVVNGKNKVKLKAYAENLRCRKEKRLQSAELCSC